MRIEISEDTYKDIMDIANMAKSIQFTIVSALSSDTIVIDIEPSSYKTLKEWSLL